MIRLWTSLLALGFAWLCAQQPQGLVVEVVHWLRGAAQFSHQEQLALELRVMLAKAEAPADEMTRVASSEDHDRGGSLPGAPAPAVTLAKISLVLVEHDGLVPPAATTLAVARDGMRAHARSRDVPEPVPRVA